MTVEFNFFIVDDRFMPRGGSCSIKLVWLNERTCALPFLEIVLSPELRLLASNAVRARGLVLPAVFLFGPLPF